MPSLKSPKILSFSICAGRNFLSLFVETCPLYMLELAFYNRVTKYIGDGAMIQKDKPSKALDLFLQFPPSLQDELLRYLEALQADLSQDPVSPPSGKKTVP